jgi:hypothetical protein
LSVYAALVSFPSPSAAEAVFGIAHLFGRTTVHQGFRWYGGHCRALGARPWDHPNVTAIVLPNCCRAHSNAERRTAFLLRGRKLQLEQRVQVAQRDGLTLRGDLTQIFFATVGWAVQIRSPVWAAGKERFHFRLTHVREMIPSVRAIMTKAQELLDPARVGRKGAHSQSPYFASAFVLVQVLHTLHSAAQELLGQFARLNWPRPIDKPPRSITDEPAAAASYGCNLVRESPVRPLLQRRMTWLTACVATLAATTYSSARSARTSTVQSAMFRRAEARMFAPGAATRVSNIRPVEWSNRPGAAQVGGFAMGWRGGDSGAQHDDCLNGVSGRTKRSSRDMGQAMTMGLPVSRRGRGRLVFRGHHTQFCRPGSAGIILNSAGRGWCRRNPRALRLPAMFRLSAELGNRGREAYAHEE